MSQEARVCWLLGNYRDRRSVIEKIKASLDNCSITTYFDDISLEYLQMEVREGSCFEENKIIILNDWPLYKGTKAKLYKEMGDMIEKLPSHCIMVLNNLDNKAANLFKLVTKVGKVFKFDQSLERKNIDSWIKRRLAVSEKEIENEDIQLIVDSFGKDQKTIDLDKLDLLLFKLTSFVGNKKSIKKQDIIRVCIDSSDFVMWTLFTLLDQKNDREAKALVWKSIEQEKSVLAAAQTLLSLLLWRYRLLLVAKEGLQGVQNEQELVQKVQSIRKAKRSGLGWQMAVEADVDEAGNSKPMYTEAMINSAIKGNYYNKPAVNAYGRVNLFWIVESIESCMCKIRLGCTDAECIVLLEILCDLICDKVKYKEVNCLWSNEL